VSAPPKRRSEDGASGLSPTPIAMPSAIVHDWFQGFHGSERTVAAMLDLFSRDPDVFTFHAARDLLPGRLAQAIVQESRVARLPGVRQKGHDPGRWRWLLPYMPRYFAALDLSNYQLVVSSSHACAAGVRPPDGALHLCYCYTPMRYVWMPDAERGRARGLKGVALTTLRGRLRAWDLKASKRPDLYVAISSAVADRIRRFYGRDALVIHPPVALADFPRDAVRAPGRYLWVHRLVSYKRAIAGSQTCT
jgi:hypothetical protein